ncbi:MAG TPA: lactate utilization protein C [Usitatibacter sp.]|jgi:L-lactate dehydrogenase complex protein LldG|nr:lactate utilization protein C [Usitatibacter sp.]
MSARDNILGRIRKAQGRIGSEPTAAELEQVRSAIARHAVGPIPAIGRASDLVRQFEHECDRVGTTYAQAPSIEAVPAEVRRFLDANALEPRAVLWHELAGLGWNDAGVAIDDRPAAGSDRTSITTCFCAIAETGTLLLLSSPATPKATALLPETHICIASKSRLLPNMEAAFALLRAERGELPRSTWFVSGASRTADIEQTLVVGAHGPYRVHVILVP